METWEALTMSRKEVIRPGLLRALAKGQVTTRQVARALRVTIGDSVRYVGCGRA